MTPIWTLTHDTLPLLMFVWLIQFLTHLLTVVMAALKTRFACATNIVAAANMLAHLAARLVSWYNNAKHDSAKTQFDKKADLWLLGRVYALPEMAAKDVEFHAQQQGKEDADPCSASESPLRRLSRSIRGDIHSKFWFTYRRVRGRWL